MRKIILCLLVCLLSSSVVYGDVRTEIIDEVHVDETDTWTLTVPAEIKPGESKKVVLKGNTFSSKVTVTIPESIKLKNEKNENEIDVKVKLGECVVKGQEEKKVDLSIDKVNVKFGRWVGKIDYEVKSEVSEEGGFEIINPVDPIPNPNPTPVEPTPVEPYPEVNPPILPEEGSPETPVDINLFYMYCKDLKGEIRFSVKKFEPSGTPAYALNLDNTVFVEIDGENAVISNVFGGGVYAPVVQIDRNGMFSRLSAASIVLDGLILHDIIDISGMFYNCENLKYVNMGALDTTKVVDMSYLFGNCVNLERVDNFDCLDTSKVIDMEGMFYNCKKLSELNIDLSQMDIQSVLSMQQMFANCEKINSISLENFKTDRIENMVSMFENCPNLFFVDMRNIIFNEYSRVDNIFKGCDRVKVVCSNYSSIEYLEENGYLPDSIKLDIR